MTAQTIVVVVVKEPDCASDAQLTGGLSQEHGESSELTSGSVADTATTTMESEPTFDELMQAMSLSASDSPGPRRKSRSRCRPTVHLGNPLSTVVQLLG